MLKQLAKFCDRMMKIALKTLFIHKYKLVNCFGLKEI